MRVVGARRSLVRIGLQAVAAAFLIAAAVDVLWLHALSDPPESGEDGVLTSRGHTQRRTDVLWGGSLLAAGGGLLVLSAAGLLVRRDIVAVYEDGMEMRIAGPRRPPVLFPWEDVAAVRSTTFEDESGAARALVVELSDPGRVPPSPWGAAWDGSRLVVDGGTWTEAPADIAVAANLYLQRFRRDHPPDAAGHPPEAVP